MSVDTEKLLTDAFNEVERCRELFLHNCELFTTLSLPLDDLISSYKKWEEIQTLYEMFCHARAVHVVIDSQDSPKDFIESPAEVTPQTIKESYKEYTEKGMAIVEIDSQGSPEDLARFKTAMDEVGG